MATVVRNAVLRPGADPTYADGDDATWMGVDWTALQHTLDVGGQRVNVVDTGGDGPALVFLHGWSSNWQIFLLNIAAFMASHRVIAPDLPGFGASAMPAGEISIQGYARVVDGICDALGIERVSVVGNSMGGFVGAELALSFGTRVDRLGLVSAAGLSTERLARRPLLTAAHLVQATLPLALRFEHDVVTRPRLRRAAMQFAVRYPEKLSVPLAQELVLSFGRPAFVNGLAAIMDYSFRDRLPEIEIPVLIVWGENDLLVPVGDAWRYAELIGSNARVEVFHDTGHTAMLERPSRFNALLRSFLTGSVEPDADVAGVSSPTDA